MAYILTVDDDPQLLGLMTEILAREGHHVVSVLSVFKALEALDGREPDLVLTDLKIPDLDGRALTRAIRCYHPNLPVVAVTAEPCVPEDDFDAVISKPFSVSELVETVDGILK